MLKGIIYHPHSKCTVGRWDPKEPKLNFELDIAGFTLLTIGIGITVISVGSGITGYALLTKGILLIPGLPIQLFFIVSGLIVSMFGIILLFVNAGHIKLKPLKYGDDRFYADDEWRH
jgi:hypothetical protein